jgi:N-acetylglucosamine kinase-like BadF-type ATPase
MGSPVRLVIGVDGGGTSTRCVVATPDGEITGRGRSGGANPRSARDPGAALLHALTGALASAGAGTGAGPGAVGVFGLAGASEAGRVAARELSATAWHAAGLDGAPVVVPDILVAFTGATCEPSGSVLIAGTGAVAARIEEREIVRRGDGYGWLLGDEGSGVWIGLRAVRAVLAAVDGRGSPTTLTARVLPCLVPEPPHGGREPEGEALAQALIAAVHDRRPARLGRLSPVVEAAAREGDLVALSILEDAARRLVRTLGVVSPDPARPVVLAGSLLTHPTLVAGRVRESLPGHRLVPARDGAAGAAALALRAPSLPSRPEAEITAAHRRLLGA